MMFDENDLVRHYKVLGRYHRSDSTYFELSAYCSDNGRHNYYKITVCDSYQHILSSSSVGQYLNWSLLTLLQFIINNKTKQESASAIMLALFPEEKQGWIQQFLLTYSKEQLLSGC